MEVFILKKDSREKIYYKILYYFVSRNFKIIEAKEPYLIKTEIGKLFSVWMGKAKGVSLVRIFDYNDTYLIDIKTDYKKELLSTFLLVMIAFLILYNVAYYLNSSIVHAVLYSILIAIIAFLVDIYNIKYSEKLFQSDFLQYVKTLELKEEVEDE